MEIKEQVIDILADQLGIEKQKIKADSKIAEDLGADSLDTVEINQVLEERFKLTIPDAELTKIKTVQDVIDYLESKLR